jgi:tetratricopeptide (TPR) repeat protein
MSGDDVYDLYTRGSDLLERGDFAAATIPLERASRLDPDKTSIREALGRAYFRSGRFRRAAAEFEAVVERAPVNDFAHYCLGKALAKTGRPRAAQRHAALAAHMRPDRADYRAFREFLEVRAA